jgi:hypothetical protein
MLISLCSAAQFMKHRIKIKFLKPKNFCYSSKDKGWIHSENIEARKLYFSFCFHINTCENEFGRFMQGKLFENTKILTFSVSYSQGRIYISGVPGANKTLAASISSNKFWL